MPGLTDELRKMSKLNRTRKNFERIAAQIEELKEHAESAQELLSALDKMWDATSELESALDTAGEDNPLVEWAAQLTKALGVFVHALPGSEDDSITDLIEEADSAREEYEQAMDDREYSADDREEAWGALLDAVESIANATATTTIESIGQAEVRRPVDPDMFKHTAP